MKVKITKPGKNKEKKNFNFNPFQTSLTLIRRNKHGKLKINGEAVLKYGKQIIK